MKKGEKIDVSLGSVKKSIAASLLIGLGNFALLKLGNPIGPVIFAFGLLGVCWLGLNLFTGKCGFLFEKKIDPAELCLYRNPRHYSSPGNRPKSRET